MVAPDIRPFLIACIWPEKLYMVYSFFKTLVSTNYYNRISKTLKVIEKMSTGCFFVTPFNYSARYPANSVSGATLIYFCCFTNNC